MLTQERTLGTEPTHDWPMAPIGTACLVIMGQSPPGDATNASGEGLPLIGGAADIGEEGPIVRRYTSAPTKTCQPGDLVVCVRATLGKACMSQGQYCLGRGVAALRPKAGLDVDWLRYFVIAEERQLFELGTGSTFLQVSKEQLSSLEIPLPPLDEQKRIVGVLREALAEVRRGREALGQVAGQMKRFRQAVLARAFRGELTAEWREAHADRFREAAEAYDALLAERGGAAPGSEELPAPFRDWLPADRLREVILTERRARWESSQLAQMAPKGDPAKPRSFKGKYIEPSPPGSIEPSDAPDGWIIASGGQLSSFITSGSRGWARYYAPEGSAFIRVGNLDFLTARLDLVDLAYVVPPSGAEADRTRVQANDLLITITAEIGMTGVVPDDLGEGFVNQHVAIVRPVLSEMATYMAYFVANPDGGQQQLLEPGRGVTKPGLTLTDMANLAFPLAPLAEQREIVARIEALFAQAEATEYTAATALTHLRRLEQSTLRAAFAGEL